MDDELAFQLCGQALLHDAIAGIEHMPGDRKNVKDALKNDNIRANTRIGDVLAVFSRAQKPI
ncbi:MAG: hypothetical protein EOO38_03945 [Cytophagaceae bacterium]|nr:MAG: hypothetical protein EOO38_03945 [Cytophagaceae bacterium]